MRGCVSGGLHPPLMRDLVHKSWAEASWWLVNVGLPLTALSLALGWVWPVRLSSVTLGAGLVLAAVNIVGVARRQPGP